MNFLRKMYNRDFDPSFIHQFRVKIEPEKKRFYVFLVDSLKGLFFCGLNVRDFAISKLHISPVLFPFLFVKIFDQSAAMLKNFASTKEKITRPNLRSLLIAKSLALV